MVFGELLSMRRGKFTLATLVENTAKLVYNVTVIKKIVYICSSYMYDNVEMLPKRLLL